MFPDPGDLLWILLLGGWVAVDGTSFGQFMVSRPFVAATLAGWIVGEPEAGALIGLVLEAFHLGVLPVGAARYPEGGPAAVVGGAVYAASAHLPSVLLICVAFVLGWEWIAGETVRLLRQMNVRLLAGSSLRVESLQRRHLAALGADFVRGVALVGVGLLALGAVLELSLLLWGAGERLPRLVLGAVLVGLLATTARLFGGRIRLFAAGTIAGLLFLWAWP